MMDINQDLACIARQEALLQFGHFDHQTAWSIGSRLRERACTQNFPILIEVHANGQRLFACALPGTAADNEDWARRKHNVVRRFDRSSYAVGLELKRDGNSLEALWGVPTCDYAAHGGGFPIRLKGTLGHIGVVLVSGLPQRQDHELIVSVLAEELDVDPAGLLLDPAR